MTFKALRPFKYQSEPGGPMKIAKVGQEFPEAAEWKTLGSLIRRRWLTQEDGEPLPIRLQGVFRKHAEKKAPPKKKVVVDTPIEEVPPASVEKAYSQDSLKKLPKADVSAIAYSMDLNDKGFKSEVIERILAKESG